MDVHGKISAGLHIVSGLFFLLCALVIGLFFGGVAALVEHQNGDPQGVLKLLAAFGGFVLGLVALFSLAEIVGAICYLNGSEGGRICLVIFSVLALLNIPLGTAIGAYSLWALLRPEGAVRPAAPLLAPQA
jgi:hypothetical protein